MSPVLTSQGAVLATAVAVSGTVILLAFRLQKSSSPTTQFPFNLIIAQSPSSSVPASCISSDGKKREKKKKRVHFAEDVVDPRGNSEAYSKLHSNIRHGQTSPANSSTMKNSHGGMPANRAALYNGILRDRVLHRVAYSY